MVYRDPSLKKQDSKATGYIYSPRHAITELTSPLFAKTKEA